MKINKVKAIKLVWKHLCVKLNIHRKNGWYKASDIQKYINYCAENRYTVILYGLKIKSDIPLDFAILDIYEPSVQ